MTLVPRLCKSVSSKNPSGKSTVSTFLFIKTTNNVLEQLPGVNIMDTVENTVLEDRRLLLLVCVSWFFLLELWLLTWEEKVKVPGKT